MVHLEKVDANNIQDVLSLSVKESQKEYVASNTDSILEAYVAQGHAFPFAVYDDDKPVGFVMVGHGVEESWKDAPRIAYENYSIWRLMIDKEQQGKGYGRKALEQALSWIQGNPCGKARSCWVSYHPENRVAQELYRSFGFVESQEKDGEEIIAILPLGETGHEGKKDMTIPCGKGIVNIRAGAIIQKDGKFLMAGNHYVDFLYSVGGRLQFGETAEQAVVREVYEETGAWMEVDRLGFIHENYFIGDYKGAFGEEIYEIAFYFYMKVPKDWNPVCNSIGKNNAHEHLEWVAMQEERNMFPAFFRQELLDPVPYVKHFVTDDRLRLGDVLTVTIDRPIGSVHPSYPDMRYPVNYGYIRGIYAKDGEEQDAYVLGVGEPVKEYTGKWIAVIHRLNDKEDKWVIAPQGTRFKKEDIERLVHFQEQHFVTEIQMLEDAQH